jgi:hypothetical protein
MRPSPPIGPVSTIKEDDGGKKMEERRWRKADGGKQMEERRLRKEDGGKKTGEGR